MRTLEVDEQTRNDYVWKTPSDGERAKKTMKASLVARRTSWSVPLGAEVRRRKEDAHTLAGEKLKMMVIK